MPSTHRLWWPTRMEMRLENLFRKSRQVHTQGLPDWCDWMHALDPSAFLSLRMGMCFATQTVHKLYRVYWGIQTHECNWQGLAPMNVPRAERINEMAFLGRSQTYHTACPSARAGIDEYCFCWAVGPPVPFGSGPRYLHHPYRDPLPFDFQCPRWPRRRVSEK